MHSPFALPEPTLQCSNGGGNSRFGWVSEQGVPATAFSVHSRSSTQLKLATQSKDRARCFTLASSSQVDFTPLCTYMLIETFNVSTGPQTTKNIFCFKDLITRDVTAPPAQELSAPGPSTSIAIATTGNMVKKKNQTNAFRAGHGIRAVSSALAHLDNP